MFKALFERLTGRKKKAQAVSYGPGFFSEGWFRNWEVLKPVLHELIRTVPGSRRIVDFGCGPGIMIDYMAGQGYDYVGFDNSEEARGLYLEKYGKHPERYVKRFDMLNGRFDLFVSFDVFEHMTDEEILHVLGRVKASRYLLNISRVKHTPGHINLKKDRGWLRFFKKAGLRYEEGLTEAVRKRYLELRPKADDLWNRNIFVLSRPE